MVGKENHFTHEEGRGGDGRKCLTFCCTANGNAAGAGWLACDGGGGDQTEAFFNPMLFGLGGGKLNKENVVGVSSYLPTKEAWKEGGGGRAAMLRVKRGGGKDASAGTTICFVPLILCACVVHRCYEGMFTFTIYPTLFYSKWKVCREDSVAKKHDSFATQRSFVCTAGNS